MISIEQYQLLEAGVHYGHEVRYCHPKMKEYVQYARNGVHILDPSKILNSLREAIGFVTELIVERPDAIILFVSTKRQAQAAISRNAKRCGMLYVNERWLHGLLTNLDVTKKSVERLQNVEGIVAEQRFEGMTKKQRAKLRKKFKGLSRDLSGLKGINRLPDALFVVDAKRERAAISEARSLGVPTVAVISTNCSPEGIDHVIPGNDYAEQSIEFFCSRVAEAVLQGREIASRHMMVQTEESSLEALLQDASLASSKKASSLQKFAPISNRQVRAWYLDTLSGIAELDREWQAKGASIRLRALAAWNIRHKARLRARTLMANPEEVELLEARDLLKYGNRFGPSFDSLFEQLKKAGLDDDAIYEAIIKGSYRTSTGINKTLGL